MDIIYCQWLGASLLWVGLHLLLWDGRVNTLEDLEASLRSPGVRVQLPSHAALASGDLAPDTETTASKPATFLTSPQLDRLWNTWTSPDSSTRRLYTNVLYVSDDDDDNSPADCCCPGSRLAPALDPPHLHRQDPGAGQPP